MISKVPAKLDLNDHLCWDSDPKIQCGWVRIHSKGSYYTTDDSSLREGCVLKREKKLSLISHHFGPSRTFQYPSLTHWPCFPPQPCRLSHVSPQCIVHSPLSEFAFAHQLDFLLTPPSDSVWIRPLVIESLSLTEVTSGRTVSLTSLCFCATEETGGRKAFIKITEV